MRPEKPARASRQSVPVWRGSLAPLKLYAFDQSANTEQDIDRELIEQFVGQALLQNCILVEAVGEQRGRLLL